MPKLRLVELDVDMTFEDTAAKKHDGYITTEDSATAILPSSVFPWGPPVPCTIDDLRYMNTPPAYRGDCENAVVKFRNAWLPIGAMTESKKDIDARGKREALAHTRIHRQKSMKNTLNNHRQRTMSDAFKYLVIATCIVGVVAVVIIGILYLVLGSPF